MSPLLQAIATEILQPLTLVKIGVAVSMVVGLSILAEKVSTRFAGLISGFPLGAAITLFFIGIEIGPAFAARSVTYMIFGLIATMAFLLGYYAGTRLCGRRAGVAAAALSAGIGLIAYFTAAFLLNRIPVGLPLAGLCTAVSILLMTRFFRRIVNVRIENPVRLSLAICLWRAGFAALVVVVIIAAARVVGTAWAGLLSAFPVTLLPFLVIVHVGYRTDHVWAILKNVPRGLGSLIVYGTVIGMLYPAWGVWLGTLAGYLAAGVYLLLIEFAGGMRVSRRICWRLNGQKP